MTQQLSTSQLEWLRQHLRLGDNFIFADMELKRTTRQSYSQYLLMKDLNEKADRFIASLEGLK